MPIRFHFKRCVFDENKCVLPEIVLTSLSDEVTMEEVDQTTQLRAGELIIIVVVLIMWAGEDVNARPRQDFRVKAF